MAFERGNFDVTDVEAEMEEKKKKDAEKQKMGRGSKPEIRTTKDIQELGAAGKLLDQAKMAEARKKIAEGSGEVELSAADLEEVDELSSEDLEEIN